MDIIRSIFTDFGNRHFDSNEIEYLANYYVQAHGGNYESAYQTVLRQCRDHLTRWSKYPDGAGSFRGLNHEIRVENFKQLYAHMRMMNQ